MSLTKNTEYILFVRSPLTNEYKKVKTFKTEEGAIKHAQKEYMGFMAKIEKQTNNHSTKGKRSLKLTKSIRRVV